MNAPSRQHFGELRSLLAMQPSRAMQDRLLWCCAHCWEIDNQRFDEVWLPYIRASMRRWPFVYPISREMAFHIIEHPRRWQALVRSVEFNGLALTRDHLERLFDNPHLDDLSNLNLSCASFDEDLVCTLPTREAAFALDALNLSGCPLDDAEACALTEVKALSSLHALNLSGTSLTDQTARWIEQEMPTLEILEVGARFRFEWSGWFFQFPTIS